MYEKLKIITQIVIDLLLMVYVTIVWQGMIAFLPFNMLVLGAIMFVLIAMWLLFELEILVERYHSQPKIKVE